jgi:hypothetical protein
MQVIPEFSGQSGLQVFGLSTSLSELLLYLSLAFPRDYQLVTPSPSCSARLRVLDEDGASLDSKESQPLVPERGTEVPYTSHS